jgi:two-component system sensor histidine kinase HydH
MDIADYYADMLLYRAASILAPIFAAGLTALFLVLSAGNRRYRRRAEERENLARLGEIARTLAHEIRNPLSAMRIQTGLLRRDLPGGKSRELDVMEEEIERLTLLSRRVGDFLKNPAGAPEPLDVARFVRDLAGRLPWPVDLGECANPAEPVLVSFDRDLLRSVIENLARNARESYAETGGATGKRVEICLSVDDSRVTFSVRDRGRGIPPELAEKVFDPFFTDKLHGSGVGLSLSRRFVEAAGGSLVLVPREGGGTEARVVLPRAGK